MVIQDGSKVAFDYKLTVDGEVVDSSDGKAPLQYVQGQKQIIPGLEKELAGMKAGEEKEVSVSPREGYGELDPNAFREMPKTSLPADMKIEEGMMLAMQGPGGQAIPVRVSEVKEDSFLLDLNHPLAGKTLKFSVKVVSIE